MAFGGFQSQGDQQPMVDINTTPLVDVMLVLLIIFIITAPLLTHSIRIDLPQAQGESTPQRPQTVTVTLDGGGKLFWDDEAITLEALSVRLAEAAARSPQPELHLRADRDTRYQVLAEVMSLARVAGVTRIGFVTDPSVSASPRAGAVPDRR